MLIVVYTGIGREGEIERTDNYNGIVVKFDLLFVLKVCMCVCVCVCATREKKKKNGGGRGGLFTPPFFSSLACSGCKSCMH